MGIEGECPGLEYDLNAAMEDGEYEINGREPRECYALPLHLKKEFSKKISWDGRVVRVGCHSLL